MTNNILSHHQFYVSLLNQSPTLYLFYYEGDDKLSLHLQCDKSFKKYKKNKDSNCILLGIYNQQWLFHYEHCFNHLNDHPDPSQNNYLHNLDKFKNWFSKLQLDTSIKIDIFQDLI